MKIYLASNFEMVEKVQKLADHLRSKGHEITVEWWKKDYKKSGLLACDWYQRKEVAEVSRRNFNGIKRADALVLICPDSQPTKFNGANVEVGYALALNKPVFSVGRLDRSAMYLPVIKCFNTEELDRELKQRRLEEVK